jgi:hypothetical protein
MKQTATLSNEPGAVHTHVGNPRVRPFFRMYTGRATPNPGSSSSPTLSSRDHFDALTLQPQVKSVSWDSGDRLTRSADTSCEIGWDRVAATLLTGSRRFLAADGSHVTFLEGAGAAVTSR